MENLKHIYDMQVLDFSNNDQTAFQLLESRKLYEQYVHFSSSLNLWNKATYLYGKVDYDLKPVVLSETNLKQVESTGKETIFVVDFVVEAFNELKKYLKKINSKGLLPSESFLKELKVSRGWVSVNNLYYSHFKFIHDVFVSEYLVRKGKEKEVQSFEQYLEHFLLFLSSNTLPILRSKFVLSNFCDIKISGLVLEIDKKDFGNDEIKIREFIQKPEFEFYVKIAKQHGFMIDKNAPWRLIANISSEKMLKYAKKYNIDIVEKNLKTDLFDVYYYDAQKQDLEILKQYLTSSYESFLRSYPIVCVNGKNKKRQVVTQELLKEFYDQSFWIGLLIKIMFLDNKKNIYNQEYYSILKESLLMFETLGIDKTINNLYTKIR